ncbi:hypothetical protein [Aureibacter tunicatorum]|uniref:YD repeat-containing protein n=1 Tax=Aureibacter tunicatorum TaxID=866807 RepID=A0AAE3XMS6_9BACT|nr:hypothetical protein [Aureibacter tunicatorum]MDR6240786.1 YD repeat-containing protein [Aureibacter tunicatorum]BDD06881.1 hypothetical protein AUTU_43640 [Aureibacter tunicatorum]
MKLLSRKKLVNYLFIFFLTIAFIVPTSANIYDSEETFEVELFMSYLFFQDSPLQTKFMSKVAETTQPTGQSEIESYKSAGNDCLQTNVMKYDPRGQMKSWIQNEYDEHGRKLKQAVFDNEGVVQGYQLLSYGYSGSYGEFAGAFSHMIPGDPWSRYAQYLSYTSLDPAGLIVSQVQRHIENQINVGREYLYGKGSELKGYMQHFYDEQNNRVQTFIYNQRGRLQNWLQYEYDEYGQPIATTLYDSKGQVEGYVNNHYQEYRNYVDSLYNSYRGKYDEYKGKIEYEYNSAGEKINQTYLSAQGTVLQYTTYQYDQFGNMVSSKYYDAKGQMLNYATATFNCP